MKQSEIMAEKVNPRKVHSTKSINFIINDSIQLLLKNPILFVPKLLIAILYGVGTIIAVDLVKQLSSFQSLSSDQILANDFSSFFTLVCLLMVFTILTFFIDIFFSGFYPILVSLAEKKKLSFKNAFVLFKPKINSVLFSGIIIWVLITLVSLLEASIILYFNLSDFGIVLSFIITFVFVFVFYFLYPKIVFEDSKLNKSFVESIFVSLKNKKLVFVLSLIPFSVSIIKFILAYFSDSLLSMVLFWGLVVLTGLIYSIHAVVNQLAYDKIIDSKK